MRGRFDRSNRDALRGRFSLSLVDHFRRQFAYDAWANREVLAAIRNSGGSERALQLMAHILSAEQLWLERLTARPQSMPVWPKADTDVDQYEAQAAEIRKLWDEYLDAAGEDLAKPISYKNSKGEAWTSTAQDILVHVIMHSAYHRGQIASHMREHGQTPAYTDFIHGIRQGLVK